MRYVSTVGLFLFSIVVAFLMGEGVVRAFGYSPWTAIPRFDGIPTMTQPDPQLGWVNRSGRYEMAAVPGMRAVPVTIAQSGDREVPIGLLSSRVERESIWFTGCSLTFGWGVADSDTYPAVVSRLIRQNTNTTVDVRDFGVAGYGTLQTWQLFKRQLELGQRPDTVFYGYFSGHGERNLGLPSFTRVLDQAASKQAWVKMPYVRLDSRTNELAMSPPQRYHRWAGAQYSATINLAQSVADKVEQRSLEGTKSAVSLALIKKFARDAHDVGARFVVLILFLTGEDQDFRQQLTAAGIEYLDLTGMGFPDESTIIVGDGHPNEKMHQLWGTRIATFLGEERQSSSTLSR